MIMQDDECDDGDCEIMIRWMIIKWWHEVVVVDDDDVCKIMMK